MKKKLRIVWMVSVLALLPACDGIQQSGTSANTVSETPASSSSVKDPDVYTEKEPILAPDSALTQYEDIPFTYDNKMIMEGIGGSKEVPDPFVYRFNGYYYLYPTTGGGFVKAYKSADLFNWEPVDNGVLNRGYVYSYSYDGSGVSPADTTPYAPEVIYFNGKFYMITSPAGNGHYVLESDSPEGPFTCISENIGHSIDGSFFIDGEENIYLYGANSSSIRAYAMDDDFTTFLTDDSDQELMTSLQNCRVGNWNEGPYMLQRNGSYYLTYCGTHYLSRDYRVDYAYCQEGSDLLKSSSYTREDTVVLSTEDDFYGLGHSCTVLGPDMDSYYIAYHNLESNNLRYLNLSRLSFNGSMMVANDVKASNLIGVDVPPFYTYDIEGCNPEGRFLLSPNASGESFTCEFNTVGEGKMIFSYIDADNYSYMEFRNNAISIHKVIEGTDAQKYQVNLNRTYATDVLHTFRLQYHKGKMNLYFDNIEKAYNVDAYFTGGKIGYEADMSFTDIGYTAFSNVALGSSDSKMYNSSVSLANAYDEELSYLREGSGLVPCKKGNYVQEDNYNLVLANQGDRATYRVYEEEGTYSIDLRVSASSLGKKIGIRVDDGEIREFTIADNTPRYTTGDVLISVGEVYLTEGQHNLSFYHVGDEVSFSEIRYEINAYDDDFAVVFDSSFDSSDYNVRNSLNLSGKGIFTDDQNACGVISKTKHKNVTAEAEVTLNSAQSAGFVGLLLNVSDYSQNYSQDGDGGDNISTYRGYLFALEGSSVYLSYVDFNYSTKLKLASVNYSYGNTVTMKIVQDNTNYRCYLDDTEVININANIGNLSGNVGVFASRCSAYISSLNVYA